MSSLAELPELVGFFSYSRRDDLYSDGALSRLRARIHGELRLQLGRDFRLWQDTAAIPEGALWQDEINRAIAESVFFIPIVTPSAIASGHCRFEFESFLNREAALGRANLVFPLLYVRVPALEREEQWRRDDLLKIIGTRQFMDWQTFRHRDLFEPEVARRIELYCRNIVESLSMPWVSPVERRAREEAERHADEAQAKRRTDEAAARAADEARRAREAEAARLAEAQRRAEAEALSQRGDDASHRTRAAPGPAVATIRDGTDAGPASGEIADQTAKRQRAARWLGGLLLVAPLLAIFFMERSDHFYPGTQQLVLSSLALATLFLAFGLYGGFKQVAIARPAGLAGVAACGLALCVPLASAAYFDVRSGDVTTTYWSTFVTFLMVATAFGLALVIAAIVAFARRRARPG
jgi:hypothetical protein